MSDYKELVRRLRCIREKVHVYEAQGWSIEEQPLGTAREAADAIEKLSAEVERLKQELTEARAE